jgi:hypothetical protein
VTSATGRGPGRETRFLVVVLAVALALRAGFLVVAIRMGLDQLAWDEIAVAQNLAAGRGYTFDYYAMFGPASGVSAFFPPVYVANVWLLLALFHSTLAVAIQNVLLSWAVVGGVYALTRRLFDPFVARIALVISALYPPFITRITHGNGLYFKMLLVVLLVIALHEVWVRPRVAAALRAGLLAGVLVLTMPDAALYVLLFVATSAVGALRGRRALAPALVVLATTALCVAPWTIRNWTVFHRLCVVSTNGGFNLYMGQNPATTDEMDFDAITELDRRLGGALARADEAGRDRILERESVAYMLREPGRAAGHMLRRAVLHWGFRPSNRTAMGLGGPGDARDYSRSYVLYIWSYAIAYTVLALAAVAGLWRCRSRWPELVPVLLVFAYSTAVAALFVVQTKMRLAKVEPAMVPFAALAVSTLWRGRREADATTPVGAPTTPSRGHR